MTIRLIAFLLSLAMTPGCIQACSIVIQITLDFPAQSAELDRTQIIRLANWLDQARSWYEYESAEVEGSSSMESPDSKNLALRRAEAAVHALQGLYQGLPTRSSGYAYPLSIQPQPHAAVIQLIISNPPKCGATPIPGFKR